MSDSIGAILRAARERGGKTQAEIARRVRVKRPTVSAWEAGTCNPLMKRLPAVVEAYGMNDDERRRVRELLGV
jgi:transcriptional regulator with XRE-family HTH domain